MPRRSSVAPPSPPAFPATPRPWTGRTRSRQRPSTGGAEAVPTPRCDWPGWRLQKGTGVAEGLSAPLGLSASLRRRLQPQPQHPQPEQSAAAPLRTQPPQPQHRPAMTAVAMLLAAVAACALAAPQLVVQPLDQVVDPASSTAAPEAETSTWSQEQESDCSEQIGQVVNGEVVNTMRKYDVEKILEEHGGAAGKLNVTRNLDVPEFPVKDPAEKPLQDTDDTTYYVYDYRRTDYKTFVRVEHALIRHKGKQDQFEDVRGELYWTPPDFCGKLRHATYRVDPEGFAADVTLEYCFLNAETLTCALPATCHSNDTYMACVAAPSNALLASLVG